MTGRRSALLVLLTGAVAIAAAPRAWLSDGPPPGHTGGFGEPTCTVCHQPGGPAAHGILEIAGLPAVFTPGASYDFEVISRSAGMTRAGFQLAVRYAAGDSSGRQAGVLRLLEPLRTQFVHDSALSIQYAEHTADGTTAMTPGELRWQVRWVAPAVRRRVVFHAASVQANDDNSPIDDAVRVTAFESSPAVP